MKLKGGQTAKIKLFGTTPKAVDGVCNQIKDIAKRTGVDMSGPVPLPTKKLVIPCRKSPDGEGAATWDHWEMRIHRRLICLEADERALRKLMRVDIPSDVNIELTLK